MVRKKSGRPKMKQEDKVVYQYISVRPEAYRRIKNASKLYRVSMVQLLDDLSKDLWK